MKKKMMAAAVLAVAFALALCAPLYGDSGVDAEDAVTEATVIDDVVVVDGEFHLDGMDMTFAEGGVISVSEGATIYLDGSYTLTTDAERAVIRLSAGSFIESSLISLPVAEDTELVLDGTLFVSDLMDANGVTRISIDVDGSVSVGDIAVEGTDGVEIDVTLSFEMPEDLTDLSAIPVTLEVSVDVDHITFPASVISSTAPSAVIVADDVVLEATMNAVFGFGESIFDPSGFMFGDITASYDLTAGGISVTFDHGDHQDGMAARNLSSAGTLTLNDGVVGLSGPDGGPLTITAESLTFDGQVGTFGDVTAKADGVTVGVDAVSDGSTLTSLTIDIAVDSASIATGGTPLSVGSLDATLSIGDGSGIQVEATVATMSQDIGFQAMTFTNAGIDGVLSDSTFVGTVSVSDIQVVNNEYAGWDFNPGNHITGLSMNYQSDGTITMEVESMSTTSIIDGLRYYTETYTGYRTTTSADGVVLVADSYRLEAVGLDGRAGYMEVSGLVSSNGISTEGDYVFAFGHSTYSVLYDVSVPFDRIFQETEPVEFRDSYMPDVAVLGDVSGTVYFCTDDEYMDAPMFGTSVITMQGQGYDLRLTFADNAVSTAELVICSGCLEHEGAYTVFPEYDSSMGGIPYTLNSDGTVATLDSTSGTVTAVAEQSTVVLTINGVDHEYMYGEMVQIVPTAGNEEEVFVGWYDGSSWYTVYSEGYYPAFRDATITEIWVPEEYEYSVSGDTVTVDISPIGFFMDDADDIIAAAGDATVLEVRNDEGSVYVDIEDLWSGYLVTAVLTQVHSMPTAYLDGIVGDGTVYMVGAYIEVEGEPHYLSYTADINATGSVVKMDEHGCPEPMTPVEGDGFTSVSDGGFYKVYYVFGASLEGAGSDGGDDNALLYAAVVVVVIVIIVAALVYSRSRNKDA